MTLHDKEINLIAMERLIHNDLYLSFIYKDLMKRNNDDQKLVIEVIYNSNVLDDFVLTDLYQAELKKIK